MARNWDVLKQTCPSRTALTKITSTWTALTLLALGEKRQRFRDLQAAVGGISRKTLSDTLRHLERDYLTTNAEAILFDTPGASFFLKGTHPVPGSARLQGTSQRSQRP